MGVETDHEEEGKVVGVPEGLEALRTNLLVGSGVHEDHDEEHEVTGETTRLGVVDLLSKLLTNLSTLDVDEVDIMRSRVNHSPEEHLVSDLTMEPDILVGREEPRQLGANDSNDVTEHGHENHATIESENQSGTTRRPHGPLEGVQTSQPIVSGLRVPPITEDTDVDAVEDDVEGKPPRGEELTTDKRLSHCSK